MRDIQNDTFTFVPIEGDTSEYPYALEPVRPGTLTGAVVSFRRIVTLRKWANSFIGPDAMRVSSADVLVFRNDSDRVMFATFWNGTKVELCSVEEMQEYAFS